MGPSVPHYCIPLDRPVLYRFVPGDTSTVDHRRVLSCNGGGPGRWLQVGEFPITTTAVSVGAGGATVSLAIGDNEAHTFTGVITGRCTAGADVGDVWSCSLDTTVKRGVGVATISAVGTDTIAYRRDAGGFGALPITVTPNATTGNLDLVLPGVAATTMAFAITLLDAKA